MVSVRDKKIYPSIIIKYSLLSRVLKDFIIKGNRQKVTEVFLCARIAEIHGGV